MEEIAKDTEETIKRRVKKITEPSTSKKGRHWETAEIKQNKLPNRKKTIAQINNIVSRHRNSRVAAVPQEPIYGKWKNRFQNKYNSRGQWITPEEVEGIVTDILSVAITEEKPSWIIKSSYSGDFVLYGGEKFIEDATSRLT
jgi:hypothetical protein